MLINSLKTVFFSQVEFLAFGRAIGEHVLTKGSYKSVIVSCGFRTIDPDIIPLLLTTLESVNVWN